MEDELIEILESYDRPVYRQGSMSADEEYPITFITFWSPDSYDHSHYDNNEHGITYTYRVIVYSSDPEACYDLIGQIITDLKSAGWIVTGRGYDAPSDEETHIGRAIDVTYIKY